MQDPKNSHSRKRWYQRAMEMATTQWKTLSNNVHATEKSKAATSKNGKQQLRKCSSLSMATASFTRVCLCAPISSYSEVFRADHQYVPPRRSYSYPRSKPEGGMMVMMINPNPSNNNNNNLAPAAAAAAARVSTEGRRVFRGKSLTDDVLMRRFVVEEEEAMMQVRRRNQMEIIRSRSVIMRRRKKLGPSPLSRMALAEEEL